jgi:hypothetical protein
MIKSRRVKWAKHAARMGEKWNAYRISVEKPEGKRPLGRSKHRLESNIEMNLRQDWLIKTGLIWFRLGTSEGLL